VRLSGGLEWLEVRHTHDACLGFAWGVCMSNARVGVRLRGRPGILGVNMHLAKDCVEESKALENV